MVTVGAVRRDMGPKDITWRYMIEKMYSAGRYDVRRDEMEK